MAWSPGPTPPPWLQRGERGAAQAKASWQLDGQELGGCLIRWSQETHAAAALAPALDPLAGVGMTQLARLRLGPPLVIRGWEGAGRAQE